MLTVYLVWHGTQEKYQIFDSLGGRFNSEFGMEAFPHLATIEYFIENDADKFSQSHVVDFHNKADGHERRLATYLVENVRLSTDLEVSLAFCLLYPDFINYIYLQSCPVIYLPYPASAG